MVLFDRAFDSVVIGIAGTLPTWPHSRNWVMARARTWIDRGDPARPAAYERLLTAMPEMRRISQIGSRQPEFRGVIFWNNRERINL